MPAHEQVRLFARVLDVVEPLSDLINRLVTVDADGRVEIQAWPDAASASVSTDDGPPDPPA